MTESPPPPRPPLEIPPLAGERLLVAWEQGLRASSALRPSVLVAATCTVPLDLALDLPLGRRDATLLRLRLATFGSDLRGLDRCPRCSQEVEFRIDVRDLLAGVADPVPSADDGTLDHADWQIRFRAATPRDLLESATPDAGPDEIGARIVRRCVTRALRHGSPVSAEALPTDLLDAIARAQIERDPLSEILFQLDCPGCRQRWESHLDCGAFLWRELSVAARRLLRDIHQLATAYGWTQDAILGLAPERRRAYLDLVEAVPQ